VVGSCGNFAEEVLVIEKLVVQEGFLDGLELNFTTGLNVLIGSRGVGKTSVIELIRFCLEVPGYTDRHDQISREHALSILGTGKVTLTIKIGEEKREISRTANSESIDSDEIVRPIILSQNEVEHIGIDVKGRLRLIEGFLKSDKEIIQVEKIIYSKIQTVCSSLKECRDDIQSSIDLIEKIKEAPELLKAEEEKQARLSGEEKILQSDQKKLADISTELNSFTAQYDVLEKSIVQIFNWTNAFEMFISSSPNMNNWTDLEDLAQKISGFQAQVDKIQATLSEQLKSAKKIGETLDFEKAETLKKIQNLEEEARKLRVKLESAKKGAGDAARQVELLRKNVATLKNAKKIKHSQDKQIEKLTSDREEMLNELETLRERRFDEREKVAAKLNEELNPKIKIEVKKYEINDDYERAITSTLKGTGVKHSSVVPQIAESFSPRELVELAELDDYGRIAETIGIGADRAKRLLLLIRENGIDQILTCNIEDGVRLLLLDGSDYKSTEQLSTGQRCTVVLPLLLAHKNKILILDQPEDHLDNAFITETLIPAIRHRQTASQLIISSHNANIPVLGEALNIIHLDSDGKRGFKKLSGKLTEHSIVESITNIMEGGREAFKKRAKFYADNQTVP
jgi:hypothetical protein